VEPHGVRAFVGIVRVALVDQRDPGGVETVDLDPGLDRDGFGEVERGVVGDLRRLQAVELQGAVEPALPPG